MNEFDEWLSKASFKSRISFYGQVTQEELTKTYSLCDLYVVSSRVETANVSMLEAMACGCSVVTTSIGAPETLINDDVGIAVPTENPKLMAEAILTSSQRKYNKADLREFVIQNYSKEAVVGKMQEAYKRALEG